MLKAINKHFSKLSNYPRLRVLLIVVAVIVGFIVVMNLLRPKDQTPVLTSNVQTASPNQGGNVQKASDSQAANYNQLHNQATQQATQQAVANGNTIFQDAFAPASGSAPPANPSGKVTTTTTTDHSSTSSTTTFAAANAEMEAGSANPQDTALAQQVQTLQQQLTTAQKQAQQEHEQQSQQAAQQQFSATENAMRSGLQNLSAGWSSPRLVTVGGGEGSSSGSGIGLPSFEGPVSIKAGTILFGVIDTALDSNQPNTPVLAHIVEGKYKGARLMGGFTASAPSTGSDGALVIQFSSMSLPTVGHTFGINAYAVDAKTGNNSVVTSVNNHYLLRYGMLFASSFLQGFGNAYQSYTYNCPPGTQNCSVVNTNSSGTTNLATTPTTQTAMYQGLGQLGQNAAQAAAQEFNTPPTIKVAQGTGIGVLFMSDLRIPYN